MDNKIDPLDPENMLAYIDALAEDLEKAWQLGSCLPLPEFPGVERIVIAGMGGSAIGGDLLSAYLAPSCRVPIISHRNYGLPGWAQGKDTLVICSSHSGNTEETLSSFDEALQRGCQVMALCTGGSLRARAEEHSRPVWTFEHHGQPRTAIPYSFGMLLALVCRLRLQRGGEASCRESVCGTEGGVGRSWRAVRAEREPRQTPGGSAFGAECGGLCGRGIGSGRAALENADKRTGQSLGCF